MTTASRRMLRMRLAAQRISTGKLTSPADVVRWMTAMQAQDFNGARWAVALRTDSATQRDMDHALASGTIVRSWPMRGTLHFVAPEDLRWILGLTTERLLRQATTRLSSLGLDERQIETARYAAIDALHGGRSLSRMELYRAFERGGVSANQQRGYQLLWILSQTGTLCFGPPDGNTQTFALLDDWVPTYRQLEGDEALGELARRYFAARGPATIRDFAWWASLRLADARRGLAVARDDLELTEFDGAEFFHEAASEQGADGIRLLPAFDEYLLGYQDRSLQLDGESLGDLVPGGNGVFPNTLVVDGVVRGTWRRPSRATSVEVTPFEPLKPRAEAGLRRPAREYARFRGEKHAEVVVTG
ncbi:winged helix DNA-binding domain-containing protein [Cryobacterium sp. BB736]|uniref:winged helix DNA-binding domain-containing protein n=1 Tax=Cryobacterium sp. BB736 TaxID=2746963 RepID=UPI0018735D57